MLNVCCGFPAATHHQPLGRPEGRHSVGARETAVRIDGESDCSKDIQGGKVRERVYQPYKCV